MTRNLLFVAIVILILLGVGYIVVQNQMFAKNIPSDNVAVDGAVQPTPADTTPVADVTPPAGVTPGKPVPTTNSTVAPSDTTAVVTGTVMPGGAITAYWYEYGTTKDLGKKTAVQVVGSGYTAISTPGYITGLAKNTTYYFRLVAQNSFGNVYGETKTLTTTSFSSAPVGSIPTVSTSPASGITSASATLKGTVNPNKASTQYWFEIGKNGTLGGITTFTSVGDGSSLVPASVTASNLEAGTTYYYRINAQNQYGTVNGAILTFKTAGKLIQALPAVPVVTTQVTSAITASNATVNGTVNPYGTETSYLFEYATSASFAQAKTTQKKSAGAVSTTVSVQATLTGLKTNTTYYVHIVAENPGGKVTGESQTFQTK